MQHHFLLRSCFLLTFVLTTQALFSTIYTWNSAVTTGAWEDPTNWTPSTDYPRLAGDIAIFSTISGASNTTVTVGTNNENLTLSFEYKGKFGDKFQDNRFLAEFLFRF